MTAAEIKIDPKRLAKLETKTLKYGSHTSAKDGMCALEAVAWLAREPHSDHPACTCPVIASFVRRMNDRLRNDDERNTLLRPLLPTLIGTVATGEVMVARGHIAADWAVRTSLPILYRALGFVEEASMLAETRPVVDRASALLARPVVADARQRVRSKMAAADYADYAGYAAAAAAYAADAADAAAAAAYAAAHAAADYADYADYAAAAADAAHAAADYADYAAAAADAAYAARHKRLAAVRGEINASAVGLIRRMCATPQVGHTKGEP